MTDRESCEVVEIFGDSAPRQAPLAPEQANRLQVLRAIINHTQDPEDIVTTISGIMQTGELPAAFVPQHDAAETAGGGVIIPLHGSQN